MNREYIFEVAHAELIPGSPFDDPYLREEVVRCRDCWHYKPYRTAHHGTMYRCIDEHAHSHKRDPNDFCSRGKRLLVCKCGEEMESEGVCPACGRSVLQDG